MVWLVAWYKVAFLQRNRLITGERGGEMFAHKCFKSQFIKHLVIWISLILTVRNNAK